ncbi:MAG: hypothetical protein AAF358_09860 [Pseudomonadota bacterium]
MQTALTEKSIRNSVPAARALLVSGAVLSLVVVALAFPDRKPVVDPDLLALMTFMATIKAATALGAMGLSWWRLGRAASDHLSLALLLGPGSMIGASFAIWQLQHLLPAMIVFYGGLALVLWAAFVDKD